MVVILPGRIWGRREGGGLTASPRWHSSPDDGGERSSLRNADGQSMRPRSSAEHFIDRGAYYYTVSRLSVKTSSLAVLRRLYSPKHSIARCYVCRRCSTAYAPITVIICRPAILGKTDQLLFSLFSEIIVFKCRKSCTEWSRKKPTKINAPSFCSRSP